MRVFLMSNDHMHELRVVCGRRTFSSRFLCCMPKCNCTCQPVHTGTGLLLCYTQFLLASTFCIPCGGNGLQRIPISLYTVCMRGVEHTRYDTIIALSRGATTRRKTCIFACARENEGVHNSTRKTPGIELCACTRERW